MHKEIEALREDVWSEWLLHLRHADDLLFGDVVRSQVESYADRVLDEAHLLPGMTLADIGTGEGLVAFRAIERIGPSLQVILTDLSAPMLRRARASAAELNVSDQCTFLECPAEQLTGIADSSVDVVTCRAVLAYVPDKVAAFREFLRILKPGGRISIAEPVFQDEAIAARVLKMQVDLDGPDSKDLFLSLLHRWKAAQYPDTEELGATQPHVNYSERDLLRFALNAGFGDAHLELHIDVKPSPNRSWEVFIGTSPHPWAPSLSTIFAEQFTPEECRFFEEVLRPIVESPSNTETSRIVYMTAKKPL